MSAISNKKDNSQHEKIVSKDFTFSLPVQNSKTIKWHPVGPFTERSSIQRYLGVL